MDSQWSRRPKAPAFEGKCQQSTEEIMLRDVHLSLWMFLDKYPPEISQRPCQIGGWKISFHCNLAFRVYASMLIWSASMVNPGPSSPKTFLEDSPNSHCLSCLPLFISVFVLQLTKCLGACFCFSSTSSFLATRGAKILFKSWPFWLGLGKSDENGKSKIGQIFR